MSELSDSTDSPSLPSLSLPSISVANAYYNSPQSAHLNADTKESGVPSGGGQQMTIRDYDTKLNELRRENFNLKLKIYFLDKEKTGNAGTECESAIAKELLKREKTIKAYQKVVDEKDAILREVKLNYESKLNEKNIQIDSLANDKETLTNEVTEISSVCRLLMAHLNEFIEFWKLYLPIDDNNPNNIMASLLNSSEDLLNSASVLITNEANGLANNMSVHMSALGASLRNGVLSATGMSSLGLLPDITELADSSNAKIVDKNETPPLLCKSIQTDIEDDGDMLNRLENMRICKERLERAITKQLRKTDKLLKKARVSLKEDEQI